MPKFSPKVKDKHNEIMTSLYDYINKAAEEHDYVKFKNRLKSRLPPLYIKLGENVTDYIDHLEKKGKIFPGNYKELKDILDGIDTRIVQLLEDGEEEIQQLISQEDNVSSTTVSDARPDILYKRSSDNIGQSSSGATTTTAKKSKISLETYPKEANQTGLIIIINFTKDREGSEQDGYKLESFFREVLGYVVKRKEDMTREGLLASLKEDTSKLNDLTNRQKYHSIMVVVMSHGDKEGIVTHDDKRVTMEEIMEFFKNDKLKCFADRPKVFFVQACRGTDDQGTVDIPDDLPPVDIEDVVGSVPVPVDANILVAYATTPGYKAYRRPSSEIGAWFIHALIEVFKEMHTQCHLEDMLISVRAMLAEDPTFERSTKKTRQMPCTWSTLTKRLYL
uniref:Putative caspase-3 n=1 Tax=Pinctada fucata TaxID=50426 RepID=A0A194AP64_PINFU